MILIFAGAGASSAVSQEKYPTTIEYFEKLSSQIKSNLFFKSAESDIITSSEQLDIENILFRLNLLQKQFDQTSQINPYKDYYEAVIRQLQIKPDLNNLIENINKQVFSFYGQIPTKEEVKTNWLRLFEILEKKNNKYEIVTTNYDTNIESALDFFEENNSSSISHGFIKNPGQGEELSLNKWTNFDPTASTGLITKLHGSVNWYGDRHHIHRSRPRYQGPDSHPIIYPGFKGDPNQNNRISVNFHNYLKQMLPHVTHVLFIGFAFRDEYINNLLNDINNNAKIINIGYGKEPTTVPHFINRRRIDKYQFLGTGFGEEALNKFEELLSTDQ